MNESVKTRAFTMVLYPYEDLNHFAVMDKLESGKYLYCAINHDKDRWTEDDMEKDSSHVAGELKKNHTHVVLKFRNPRYKTAVASELGLEPNYIQECRNVKGALLYLVHENAPNMYQYDFEEVYGHNKHELNKLLADEHDEGSRVLRILDLLDSLPSPCSYRKLLVAVCENGMYGEFRRMGSGVMRLLDEHNFPAYNENLPV